MPRKRENFPLNAAAKVEQIRAQKDPCMATPNGSRILNGAGCAPKSTKNSKGSAPHRASAAGINPGKAIKKAVNERKQGREI